MNAVRESNTMKKQKSCIIYVLYNPAIPHPVHLFQLFLSEMQSHYSEYNSFLQQLVWIQCGYTSNRINFLMIREQHTTARFNTTILKYDSRHYFPIHH
jgi:hypothetical protein